MTMTERSTADESTTTATLGHKAARGFAYAGVMFASERLLIFIATLVLARLLLPDDFGLVAFSLAVLNYVEVLADAGLGEALVQRTDADDDVVSSTAFWIGLAGAFGLVALTWLAAPLAARFGSEQAVAVIRVLSLDFVLSALGKVHEYRLRHSLEFNRLVLPAVAGALGTVIVGIGAAFAGAGAWSLVAGLLAGTFVRTIFLWIVFPWRPRLQVSPTLVPSFLKFGSGIVAVGLLGELAKNFDYLIVGAKLGTTALGFYYLAFRLPELAVLGVMQVANEVLFPFYARTRDASTAASAEGHDFGDRYLATVRLAAAVVVPASVGMAALASPIVLALYGPAWHAAVLPMALVACWTSLASLAAMPGAVFKAIGRTWLLTATGVAQLVVLLPLVWLAAGHGIAAVAGAQLVEKVISLAMLGVVTAHVLPVPWYASFRALVGPVLMSAVMAALVYPIGRVLDPFAALAVGIPVGCACYLVLLRVFMPDIFKTSTAPLARLRWGRLPVQAMLEGS